MHSKLSPFGGTEGGFIQGQRMSPPMDFENLYSLSKKIIPENFQESNSNQFYADRIFISSC